MNQVILMYRQNEISKDTAVDHWSSEDNVEVRIFLKKITREIYKNPESGKKYLASCAFYEVGLKLHRFF